jgi:hypothetical protein
MKARLAATIDLGERCAFHVTELDGRILVATRDTLHAVAGDALEPLISPIGVTDLSGRLVLTPHELVEIGGARRPLPALDGAEPTALVALPDGAIVAVCHAQDKTAAAVMRLDRNGRVIWRNATPPPPILMQTTTRRLSDGVETPGTPLAATQWTIFRRELCLSGDRVLAVFSDMPRTGIGVGYGLDVATGALVYTTPPAPYGDLAPGPIDGQFLVGMQGYGAFDSLLVDRDGGKVARWKSHGKLVMRDPLRVLEMTNVNTSPCYIATLRGDGSVHRGARLPGYYTSPIVLARDGAAVFWRDDAVMRASPDGDRVERLLETPEARSAWSSGFAGRAPGRVVLAWSGATEIDGARIERNRLFVIDLEA